ncbi:hypothetical protein FI667_g9902, partial [Globisporangium splendens]
MAAIRNEHVLRTGSLLASVVQWHESAAFGCIVSFRFYYLTSSRGSFSAVWKQQPLETTLVLLAVAGAALHLGDDSREAGRQEATPTRHVSRTHSTAVAAGGGGGGAQDAVDPPQTSSVTTRRQLKIGASVADDDALVQADLPTKPHRGLPPADDSSSWTKIRSKLIRC